MEFPLNPRLPSLPKRMKSLYPFEPHYLQLASDLSYHYLDEGKGDPVILLHGNPTWSFYYRHLILNLRQNYRVIAPDHVGCGLSCKPEDYAYSLENHIQNLVKLVDSLNLKSFHLVVHDWGGAIGFGALTQIARMRDKIKKIVLMNTAAFCSTHMPWQIALCRVPLLGEWIVRRTNGFALPATFMAVKKKLPREVKEMYLYPYNNYKNRVAIYQFVRDIPMHPEHPSYSLLKGIEEKLPQLDSVPKLILWGGKDFCFHEKFLQRWQGIYPLARVKIFPQAGHYVLEDAREEAVKEIENFLHQ